MSQTKGTKIEYQDVREANSLIEPGVVWVKLYNHGPGKKEYRLSFSEYKELCDKGWITV